MSIDKIDNLSLLSANDSKIVYRVMNEACQAHMAVNHLYDGKPYSLHLMLCFQFAMEYIHLVEEKMITPVLCAVWCHDMMEDARWSYNDLYEAFGRDVADLVFSVTNNTGKGRSEKADAAYYEKIISTPYAVFVKLCDRLANVWYGKITRSSMYKKYQAEQGQFENKLFSLKYAPMWNHLELLFKY